MSDKQESSDNQPVTSGEKQGGIITAKDFVDELDYNDDHNLMLYGDQDNTVCTWPEGYKPRQPLFACRTCNPDKEAMAAICFGCYEHCHVGHDLVELYTKRKIRCDCGNSKVGNDKKCTLYEEKTPVNEYNIYNHNFAGRFCKCDITFDPVKAKETMFQCHMCEDWFHLTHLGIDSETDIWKKIYDGHAMICTDCVPKYPFLAIFGEVEEKTCLKKPDAQQQPLNTVFSLKPGWRKLICNCSQCQAILELADCTFLLDEDDDIEKFEEENRKQAREVTDDDIVNELVELGGRDTAIAVIRGFHELKSNLGEFFQSKGDKVITPEDVHSFFAQLKRPRLDPDAPDAE